MWWYLFLPQYGGSSILWLLDCPIIDSELSMDACLVGAGGMSGDEMYRVFFLNHVKKQSGIVHFELWVVILAVRVWGPKHRDKIIKIHSDNEAVAHIVNTGRSQDPKLQSLLCELVWWLATYEMKIKAVHIISSENKIPDLLSRWHEGPDIHRKFD